MKTIIKYQINNENQKWNLKNRSFKQLIKILFYFYGCWKYRVPGLGKDKIIKNPSSRIALCKLFYDLYWILWSHWIRHTEKLIWGFLLNVASYFTRCLFRRVLPDIFLVYNRILFVQGEQKCCYLKDWIPFSLRQSIFVWEFRGQEMI